MDGRISRPSGASSLGTFALALVLAASSLLGSPISSARGSELNRMAPVGGPWLDLALNVASSAPLRPFIDALFGTDTIDTGSDGRLTVLLLGSDTRGGGVGLTDTIIIVSLKGNTINAASIPRDTARILNPFTPSASDTFKGRVNAILQKLRNGTTVDNGLAKFEIVIEKLLQIEIDYHAMITFNGFQTLVDEVDPISVNVGRTISDSKYWDDPHKKRGVYFPASASGSYALYAWQPEPKSALCNGLWRNYSKPPSDTWCQRALPFVRSRKGSGNSDWVRARRQQDFVGAAIRRVVARGTGSLSSLVDKGTSALNAGQLYTNIPFNSSAIDFYNALQNASLVNQVVFKPKKYASHIPGTSAYRLKLPAVRAWAARHLK